MIDQVVGFFMFALGMQTPGQLHGTVKGEQTTVAEQMQESETPEATETPESGSALRERVRTLQEERNEVRVATRDQLKEQTQNLLELQKQKAETFREQIQAAREQAKTNAEARREAFKQQLQLIRDQTKKQIVSSLDTRVSALNTARTDAMMQHLNTMSEILTRVSQRARESGKDMSVVDAAVGEAQVAINTAKSAVTVQAGKQYVFTISSEDTLRTDVGTTMQQLESDLKSVNALMTDARLKVSAAIRVLGQVLAPVSGTASDSGSL